MSRDKTYFASDVHLGFPDRQNSRPRELAFATWLDSIVNDAKELYLLGDIFDFWFEYKHVVPRGYSRIIGRLATLVDNGIKVHFFTGNHDLWVTDYLTSEAGVILHRCPLITEIDGKTFYLAHGDGLGHGDYGYKLLKSFFSNRVLQWLFARLHPNFSIAIAHAWSKKNRYSKGVVAEDIDLKRDILLNYAINLENKQHHDYYIFGHRHRPANIPICDKQATFINLGDWLTHFTYGVLDQHGFELKFFDKPSNVNI